MDGGEPYAPGGLAVGSQIAGYQIDDQIGRGGMAVVYRATDRRLNRVVALKILAPELARDAAFRERFIREMRAAAAVNHPHIVPVFDAGEANGALFIAMLYASGHDVRTLIGSEGPLPAARVADIVGQVASALDEAHARGLIHRDVKPANMLIAEAAGNGQRDHVYLSDFGLSKQSFSSASLTLTGQFLGTLDYMAPEQVEGSPIDGRADLYGLACAAYEMFTGAPPFKREHDFAAIWAQLSARPPSLLSRRPDLSPAVDQVVSRALAKSPDDRYQSCGEFAGALRASCGPAAGLAGPGAGRNPGAAAPPRPPTRPANVPGYGQAEAGRAWSAPTIPQRPLTPSPESDGPGSSWPVPPVGRGQAGPGVPWPDTVTSGRDDWRLPPPPPALAGQQAAGRRPPRSRAALVAGCIVMLAVIGFAVFLLRPGAARTPSSAGAGGGGSQPAASGPGRHSSGQRLASGAVGPAATVRAYIGAINSRDYARAWNLGGKNTGVSYPAFINGFTGTAHDYLTILSVTGNVVAIRLDATQTDGTVEHYQGTYTVNNGSITASHIQRGD